MVRTVLEMKLFNQERWRGNRTSGENAQRVFARPAAGDLVTGKKSECANSDDEVEEERTADDDEGGDGVTQSEVADGQERRCEGGENQAAGGGEHCI
jgi:hypothetical protein